MSASAILTRIEKFGRIHGFRVSVVRSLRVCESIRYTNSGDFRPSCEVFITCLPTDLYEDEIYTFFSRFGRIKMICVALCPNNNTNRGFASIVYNTGKFLYIYDNNQWRTGPLSQWAFGRWT